MSTLGPISFDRTRVLVVMRSRAGIDSVFAILHGASDLELESAVGTADGLEGMSRIRPDIVLVETGPELVAFTLQVRSSSPESGVLILSHPNNPPETQQVVEALAVGAFDVAPVLGGGAGETPLLLSKIRCWSIKQYSRLAHFGKPQVATVVGAKPVAASKARAAACDVVVIGVSTGGPEALLELLSGFHAPLAVPLVIVLHMPKEFTGAMAVSLDRKGRMRVLEVQDGMEALPGQVYLAKGGRHCLLERSAKLLLRLGDGPLEHGCRPSVDVLFRSAAELLGARTIAVVLTGMGTDGTLGAGELKRAGAKVVVQDEASSVVWGMPGSVVRAGWADEVLPLSLLAARLVELVGTL